MSPQSTNPILTLSVAASLLNIHPRTLMLYEKEYLINPFRTSTNRRLFSAADLAFIQFVKYLIETQRINISGVRVVLKILDKVSPKYPNIRKELFPDFEEKRLI